MLGRPGRDDGPAPAWVSRVEAFQVRESERPARIAEVIEIEWLGDLLGPRSGVVMGTNSAGGWCKAHSNAGVSTRESLPRLTPKRAAVEMTVDPSCRRCWRRRF